MSQSDEDDFRYIKDGTVIDKILAHLQYSLQALCASLRGSVSGDEVWFRSSHRYEGTRIGYEFLDKTGGDTITGNVDLGEYGRA